MKQPVENTAPSNLKILNPLDNSQHLGKMPNKLSIITSKLKSEISLDNTGVKRQNKNRNLSTRWKFKDEETNSQGLRNLSQIVKISKGIKNIDFHLKGIIFLTLDNLGLSLKRCTSLQSFHVTFELVFCESINIEVGNLVQGLKELRYLKTIHLDLTGFSLSDKLLFQLGQSLKRLVNPKNIIFNLKACDITDRGFYYLRQGIKRQTSTQCLRLNFAYCKKITDNGVSGLVKGMKNIASLKEIDIDFSSCDKITEQGLQYLSDGFSQLNSLQKVTFNFSGYLFAKGHNFVIL